MPNHRGKATILRFLHRLGLRQGRYFFWQMRNGIYLAISPAEGFAPWSVGWTCFEQGAWESHLERLLRSLVRPGDTVMDIGANIGYFSGVMSGCVGPEGKVWSFEPVPSTFERLALCQKVNHLSNLNPLPYALGAEEREVEIRYNPIIMGSASIYQEASSPEIETAVTKMVPLDTLVARGAVGLPDLIKIDVEGHEVDVFTGARETIAKAKPVIIFEFNTETAAKAGWNLATLTGMLTSFAGYRYYSLQEDSFLEPIDPGTYSLPDGQYVDILADCGRLDIARVKQELSKAPR